MSDVGDCFVVLCEGRFWNGQGWVDDWRAAKQFTSPPLADPWLDCDRLCRTLGPECVPAFFAAPEVRLAER
jgi:hypothetical protein